MIRFLAILALMLVTFGSEGSLPRQPALSIGLHGAGLPRHSEAAAGGIGGQSGHSTFNLSRDRPDQPSTSFLGYRFYDPTLQRWLTRDPLGEAGGINLYGFVGNDPISRVDPLGLANEYGLMGMGGGQGMSQFANPSGVHGLAEAGSLAQQAGYKGDIASASANEMFNQALQEQANQVMEFYENLVLGELGGGAFGALARRAFWLLSKCERFAPLFKAAKGTLPEGLAEEAARLEKQWPKRIQALEESGQPLNNGQKGRHQVH